MWNTKAYNGWHSQFLSLVKHVRIGFNCGQVQTQSSTCAFYNVQHFYNSKRTVTIKMHIIDHYKATENTFRSAFKISLCRRHSSQNQSTLGPPFKHRIIITNVYIILQNVIMIRPIKSVKIVANYNNKKYYNILWLL